MPEGVIIPPGDVTIVADSDCELGESPVWDEQRSCLYWTDITDGKIFRLSFPSGVVKVIYKGPPVGGFTLQPNGDLLLFRVNDIAELHPNGSVSSVQSFLDSSAARFNDVIADPNGRVFAGTIGRTTETGGLYRLDLDGSLNCLFLGTGCSNGMGFSPDLNTFYWTCSTRRKIFQFDYDKSSGTLNNRRLFCEYREREGVPDGMAIDQEGCVWSANWGGGSVVRYNPKGETLAQIDFPVSNVTSLCFGGAGPNQLFVTSAKASEKSEPSAGALFQMRLPVRGMSTFRSRIREM